MEIESSSQLRVLRPDDQSAAVKVMANAFLNDPLWQFILPNESQRTRLLPLFFDALLTASIRSGQTYGIGTPLAGVAVWSTPDRDAQLFSLRFLRLLASPLLLPFLKVIRVFAKFDELQKRYAPEPHYYLNTIGVAPEAQGKGVASKLIRPFLEEADKRGVGTYTETSTPSNVGLYEYYGFRVMEQVDFPKLNLSLWSLYRPIHQET